jgi:hypothetical protein
VTDLKEYDVPAPAGAAVDTIRVQLSDADAKELGLLIEHKPKAKKAPAPKNKAKKAASNKKA